MALSVLELKGLTLPESLLKKELYQKTPGWRMQHKAYNLFDLVSQIITASGASDSATLVDNGNGTYTYTPSTGAAVLIDTRANSNIVNTASAQVPATINTTQKAVEDLYHFMNNTKGILGVNWTNGATNPTMGTYTGWTISDNQTVKQNIQELEIAVQDAIHNADNGLTPVAGTGVGALQKKVQLGGNLIQATTIATQANAFDVDDNTNNVGLSVKAIPTFNYASGQRAAYFIGGEGTGNKAIAGVRRSGTAYIPFMAHQDTGIHAQNSYSVEVGQSGINTIAKRSDTQQGSFEVSAVSVIQRVNFNVGLAASAYTQLGTNFFRIGSSNGAMSHYNLPVIDGTAKQVLQTDGANTVSWQTIPTDLPIVIQEFLTTESVINRSGHAFYLVPPSMNGYQISKFNWSVFTTAAGTFSIQLERNGTNVTGASTTPATNAQNGDHTFTAITLATNDRIRIITSGSTGVTPRGLTIAIDAKKS